MYYNMTTEGDSRHCVLTSRVFTKSFVVYSTVSVDGVGLHSSLTAFAARLMSLLMSYDTYAQNDGMVGM